MHNRTSGFVQILCLVFTLFFPSIPTQAQTEECVLENFDADETWETLSIILFGTNDLAQGLYAMATTEAGNDLFQRIADEKLEIHVSIPQHNFDGVLYDIVDEEATVYIRVASDSEEIEHDGQYSDGEIIFNNDTWITKEQFGRAIAHELVHALDDKLGRLDVELGISLPNVDLADNSAAMVAWTEFLRMQIQLKVESEVRAYRMQMAMSTGCIYNDTPSHNDMWVALFAVGVGRYEHYADYYSQAYEAQILEYTGTSVWPKIGLQDGRVTLELVIR